MANGQNFTFYGQNQHKIILYDTMINIYDQKENKAKYIQTKQGGYLMVKKILSGNEAIAYGAAESGISVIAGYPGLPSTGIIEAADEFENIYCEWSSNEKVAMDVAIGASIAGSRVMVTMKDLGLNVAADPFFGVVGTKINGALIIVVCDDSGREQGDDMNDARHFAYMGEIPLLEPASVQEAKSFVHVAVELSETYCVPVIIRMTAIVTHSQEIVNTDEEYSEKQHSAFRSLYAAKTIASTVASFPQNSKLRKSTEQYYYDWKQRYKDLSIYTENTKLNNYEYKDKSIGFIGSGVSILHAAEAFANASIFKLGMTNPLPEKKIREFCNNVSKVYIVEESHPILEEKIKAMGVDVTGSELFKRKTAPFYITPTNIYEAINNVDLMPIKHKFMLPMQLPANCPGCPHSFLFESLKELGIKVMGDSGCYALNLYPPANSMEMFLCMGSSVNMAHGIEKSFGKSNCVAVMGDGVFYHSGINGILNLIYNNGTSTVIIADNDCIAMTGGQNTLASKCSIEKLCEAIGINRIKIIDPYDMEDMKKTILDEIEVDEPSIIISRHPCIQKVKMKSHNYFYIDKEQCKGCLKCTQVGCLAIAQKNGKMSINKQLCVGCGLCLEVCKCTAIKKGSM